jgi:dipeptidyl aminopeptidase/acylaminoacyl peptidase
LEMRFLGANAPDITIEEVVSIKHPGAPKWSPDGKRLAWIWNDGGVTALFLVDPSEGRPVQLSRGTDGVESFEWGPGNQIAYSQGKNLWLHKDAGEPVALTSGEHGDSEPRWSPGGRQIAFSRKGDLLLWDTGSGTLRSIPLPGPIGAGSDGRGIRWSPDGSRIAATVQCGGQRDLAIVDVSGNLVWRTDTADNEAAAFWIDENRVHYTVMDLFHHKREYRVHNLATGEDSLLVLEESEKGMKDELAAVGRPGKAGAVYVLSPGNWPNLFYMDVNTKELRRLTPDDADDTGHAEDFLSFSPDGTKLLFSSNRGTSMNERRLWSVDVETHALSLLTPGPGTDSCASWSPDGSQVVFLRASPYHSLDLYVMESSGAGMRRLTHSMPDSFTEEKCTIPTHVTYPGQDGLMVHGDLFLPKGFDSSKKYPAIVWLHGGMSRQMRHGWHPLQGYSIFYSFNQYLLHRGYVILSVDYRGSIGYGKAYEEATYMCMGDKELADVAEGATFLKTVDFVDKDSIGVYGISYGGFLTLGALARYSNRFAMGINIAGIWDWLQYANWNTALYPGHPWFGTFGRLGQPGEHNKEAWHNISPMNFVQGLTSPLINIMGTADVNVDFQQMDRIILDCVKHKKDFACAYYPEEVHVFKWRRTWEDAFPRMASAFDRYLKVPREKRPRAMI